MSTMHIYAQEIWHDQAYIAGTRETLEMLKLAIDRALSDGQGQMQVFASDGEGYTIHTVVMTEEQADKMPVPYTDEIARENSAGKFGPWSLVFSNVVDNRSAAPLPLAAGPVDRNVSPGRDG